MKNMSNTPFNPQPDEPQKPNEKLEESTSIGIPPPISDYLSEFIYDIQLTPETTQQLLKELIELKKSKENNRSKIIFSIIVLSGICILSSLCLILPLTVNGLDRSTIYEFIAGIIGSLFSLFAIVVKSYLRE
jgi:hypothetical protein